MILRFFVPVLAAFVWCGASDTLPVSAAPPVFAPPPSAPAASPQTPFSDEIAGRKLLFAARDYYQGSANLDFSVKVSVVNADGSGAAPTLARTATETVLAYPSARKISLSTETATGVRREVRKAISDGQNVVVTRFEDPAGKTPKIVREVVRFGANDAPFSRLVNAARYAPISAGGAFAAGEDNAVSPQSRIAWLVKSETALGVPVDVVCENDAPIGKGEVVRARRYFLDKTTHRIVRFEAWTTRQTPPRPARKNAPADNGIRLQYQNEVYTYRNGAAAAKSAAYAQNLPANYAEIPTPDLRLPPPVSASATDPKAAALLNKWQKNWERFLSYSAQVDVEVRADARTEISRPVRERENNTVRYKEVLLRRPDSRARIVQEPSPEGSTQRGPNALIIVSNGTQVRGVSDGGWRGRGDGKRVRTAPLENPAQLWRRMNEVAYLDRIGDLGGLSYVFLVPLTVRNADSITYDGQTTLDGGETVDVITLTKTNINTDKSGQQTETVTTWRVGLDAADGLPRLVESRRKATVSGRFERDQPPVTTIKTRLRRVLLNAEPLGQAFALPPEK